MEKKYDRSVETKTLVKKMIFLLNQFFLQSHKLLHYFKLSRFFTKSFIIIYFLCRRNEENRLVYIKEDPCHFFLLHDIVYYDRSGSR